jgi:hypothetical protein
VDILVRYRETWDSFSVDNGKILVLLFEAFQFLPDQTIPGVPVWAIGFPFALPALIPEVKKR